MESLRPSQRAFSYWTPEVGARYVMAECNWIVSKIIQSAHEDASWVALAMSEADHSYAVLKTPVSACELWYQQQAIACCPRIAPKVLWSSDICMPNVHLLMEAVPGTLATQTRVCFGAIKSLFQAVFVLWRADIAHHDIAPQNCGVREDGTGCLLDFGSAVTVHENIKLAHLVVSRIEFASRAVHGRVANGLHLHIQDELESALYVMLWHLMKVVGSGLPWTYECSEKSVEMSKLHLKLEHLPIPPEWKTDVQFICDAVLHMPRDDSWKSSTLFDDLESALENLVSKNKEES